MTFLSRRRSLAPVAPPLVPVVAGLLMLLLGMLGPVAPAQAGYAAIIVDYNTGRVLHEEDADERNYPASLTKMMTLYLLFDSLRSGKTSLSTRIPVSVYATRQAPSRLNLRAGSTISADDAIRALVTKSANDVAVAVGEYLGGSEAGFATMMTRKAQQLGMTRTTFRNASGLPNPQQMSTARDMAALGIALRRDFPQYYNYFSVRSFTYNGQVIPSHNRVLLSYPGADGIKTGFIAASGFNLVASARRNGMTLVGVVFGGRTGAWRDARMKELLDDGFESASHIARGGEPKLTRPVGMVSAPEISPPAALAPSRASSRPREPARNEEPSVDHIGGKIQQAMTSPARSSGSSGSAAKGAAAPPAPAEKPTGSGEGQSLMVPAGARNTWGIQIGAYSTFPAARGQADQVVSMIRNKVGVAHAAVIPAKAGDGIIYRARVLGLDNENEARQACGQLRSQNRTCIIVSPPGKTADSKPARKRG